MEENLIKKIKKLKEIEPNKDYSQKSLSYILNTSQSNANKLAEASTLWRKTITNLKVSSNIVIATIFVLIICVSAFYINSTISPLILPGLDSSAISAEAQQINQSININLNEINYYKLSQEVTKNALEKISTTTPSDPSTTTENLSNEEQINQLLEELTK